MPKAELKKAIVETVMNDELSLVGEVDDQGAPIMNTLTGTQRTKVVQRQVPVEVIRATILIIDETHGEWFESVVLDAGIVAGLPPTGAARENAINAALRAKIPAIYQAGKAIRDAQLVAHPQVTVPAGTIAMSGADLA